MPIQSSDCNNDTISEPGRDETASLLSRLTFFWVNDLIWKASRTTLEASDLYPLNRKQISVILASRFRTTTASKNTLRWRIYHFFKYDLLGQGAWAAVMSIAVFIPPILIRLILEYMESPAGTARNTAWLYVGEILSSGLLAGIADCQCEWIGHKISAKLRTLLVSEIYAKVLRRIGSPVQTTPKSNDASTEGSASNENVFNLMSIDAEVVSGMSEKVYLMWVTFPVQITIGTYLLYWSLGISGLIGMLLMIALLPLNKLLSKRVMAVEDQVLAASDARIQASNELLQNIHTIKYSAWEVPFSERVLEKRRLEMKYMRTRFVWWSISMTVFYSLPFIVTVLTFFFYTVVWKNDLGTTVAFPALAVFAVLQIPLNRTADSITFLLQANVSLARIERFLDERDTDKYNQLSRAGESAIGFDDATLAWPTSNHAENFDESILYSAMPSSQAFRLHNLQTSFHSNALNVVCGPSGSGKSTLLLALLGEMDLISGRVFSPYNITPGDASELYDSTINLVETTAYCPQEPWIMNRSIRANIILGQPFSASRYEIVLQSVALFQDLAALD